MSEPIIRINRREVRFPRMPRLDVWLHNNQWRLAVWLAVAAAVLWGIGYGL